MLHLSGRGRGELASDKVPGARESQVRVTVVTLGVERGCEPVKQPSSFLSFTIKS